MAKKRMGKTKAAATFEVRLIAPGLLPEKIPLRAVSDALSAVQDLASGRDPLEQQQVPPEKGIGLIDVGPGSAVYTCLFRAPDEAIANLRRVGMLLSAPDSAEANGDTLTTALRPIQSLSDVAKSQGCRVVVTAKGHRRRPLLSVEQDDFRRISSELFATGETTVVGTINRVGGATGMRCLLRVPGRRRILYCDVRSRELVRRLGQHLYEQIAALGTARWFHRSWKLYEFTINDFTQPHFGDPVEAIKELRHAGLSAWDQIDDPERYIQELR